jgi:FkbH-like protein
MKPVPAFDSKTIKAYISDGKPERALAALSAALVPSTPFSDQSRAARLIERNLDALDLPTAVRIAVVASSTVDHLAPLIRLWLALRGVKADVWIAPFDTVAQTCLQPGTDLIDFKADFIWLLTSWRDVRFALEPGTELDRACDIVDAQVEQTLGLAKAARANTGAQIIVNNADSPADTGLGHFDATVPWGRAALFARYNAGLATSRNEGICIFDIDAVASRFGKAAWAEARFWYHSKHAFAFDAHGLVAHAFAALIGGFKGRSKKCLVLDLDNTLWGGVIGDDGVDGICLGATADGEAFVDMQAYAKGLKERGVILAVCSKNDDANARLPFLHHPDMRLSLDDIAVFVANWTDKAANIRTIAKRLNIGLDHIVFVDDNPVERAQVRSFLPMVAVPELPDDPSLRLQVLAEHRYFEAVAFSAEDAKRSDYYAANAERSALQGSHDTLEGFLADLEMTATVGGADEFHLPRMAQLINKSNQFHLTLTRYTEADLCAMAQDPSYRVVHFKLADRFGDNGLISVIVLRIDGNTAEIDTWVMSCRVLGRQMEDFIVETVCARAREAGATVIAGRFVPGSKNALVAGLYERLGFQPDGCDGPVTRWRLDLDDRVCWPHTIQLRENGAADGRGPASRA